MVNFYLLKRVIIFGAYGLLGSYLSNYLNNDGFNIFRQGRSIQAEYTLDPLSESEVASFIDHVKPTTIINLNALTDVDLCEKDPKQCYLANEKTIEIIVQNIKANKVHLIHISSDQVYSDKGPHVEENAKPINAYSRSKFNSELIANKVDSTILRTNFVGKSFKNYKLSFTDWLIKSFLANKEINLFNDIKFSPVHQSFLGKVISESIKREIKGLFNIGSKDSLSKSDFALNLAKSLEFKFTNYNLISSKLVERAAIRPSDMSLNTTKFNKFFKINSPLMSETINLVKIDYLNEKNT